MPGQFVKTKIILMVIVEGASALDLDAFWPRPLAQPIAQRRRHQSPRIIHNEHLVVLNDVSDVLS